MIFVTLVVALLAGGSPISQATAKGHAPSVTVAFAVGDTSRYVARTSTGVHGQYVHLSYRITEALASGHGTRDYRVEKIVKAPHTDVLRCARTCSGSLTVVLWSKSLHARYIGNGAVTVAIWKS